MRDVYITDLGAFFPNAPVENDAVEGVLGMAGGRPSRARRLILERNGIVTRHYALEGTSGRFTHSNAEMTAQAVRVALAQAGLGLPELDCLVCGTSSPDQIKPAHGPMVHGLLGAPPIEVASIAGVCTAGITAMKYAYLSVATGGADVAVSTGSEFASSFMRAEQFGLEPAVDDVRKRPALSFEKDFLRWMLSDGAGAAVLSYQKPADRMALRIDWMDCVSYAGDLPVCMYSGAERDVDGALRGWREVAPDMVLKEHFFTVKQDARLLDQHIVNVCVDRALKRLLDRRSLRPDRVEWFLPHYSSEYFRPRLHAALEEAGFPLPYDRWFTNMPVRGNVGSAMIYVIIEELMASGRIQKGDRLLCMVPESARFSVCYVHLTAV